MRWCGGSTTRKNSAGKLRTRHAPRGEPSGPRFAGRSARCRRPSSISWRRWTAADAKSRTKPSRRPPASRRKPSRRSWWRSFRLVETGERWATAAALETLRVLKVDPGRLVRCAVLALSSCHAEQVAAEILADGVAFVRFDDIEGILSPLVELACPLRRWVLDREPTPSPGPLLTLHGAQPRAVEAALESFLWKPDLGAVGKAARGILVVAEADGAAAVRLSRATISKLARGLDIPERKVRRTGRPRRPQDRGREAFEHDADGTDELMHAFRLGATDTGQGRVFSVYREVLGRILNAEGLPGAASASPCNGFSKRRLGR